MRRVLLVGDYPPPYGGVSVQVAALHHRLAALGDTDVRVLDIGTRRRETRPGCLPVHGPVDFVSRILAHVRGGFIIHVHTNGHNLKSWLLTAVCVGAALAGGRRTIVSFGSGLMPPFLAAARAPFRALARASTAGAGALIVRNERARSALVELGVDPRKLVVLPGFYGVTDTEVGRVPQDVARFTHDHRPLIGAIASPGPEYGIALLIDAAARLRPRHPRLGVVLVGSGWLDGDCPRWMCSIGECGRPSLLAVMHALDVFVRPTYFDGDASSVREALALGVRVVASDTDFRPEGVRRFPCGDPDALAAAIEAALTGPAVRAASTSLPAVLSIYDALPLDRGTSGAQAAVPDAIAGSKAGQELRIG